MKRVLLTWILLFFSGLAWTQQTNSVSSNKLKVLILPLKIKSDVKKYPTAPVIRDLIFNSFYNFLGVIPSLDIPSRQSLMKIEWNETNIATLAKSRGADYVVYGTMIFKGKSYQPNARIKLKIWSEENLADSFSKNYNTPTDIDLFDTLDEMIPVLSAQLLKHKVDIATLQFGPFQTGSEKYDIYVNGKLITHITNNGFSQRLNILANTTYGVVIKRLFDKKNVHDSSFILQPNFTARIPYRASGEVRVLKLRGMKPKHSYKLLLNDEPVTNGGFKLTNAQAGVDYTVKVIEDKTNTVYSNSVYLHDEKKIVLRPVVKGGGGGYNLQLGVNDESILSVSVNRYFNSRLWMGIGAGVSYWPHSLFDPAFKSAVQGDFLFVLTSLNLGYHFIGDTSTDFRVGADLALHYVLIANVPTIGTASILPSSVSANTLSLGVFLNAEWRFLYLRIGTYYDLFNQHFFFPYPVVTGGVKFRFGSYSPAPAKGVNLSNLRFKPALQVAINDESMLQLGLHNDFSDKFWAGIGIGQSLWPVSMLNAANNSSYTDSPYFLNTYLSIGYYLIGNVRKDWRIGLQATLRKVWIANVPAELLAKLDPGINTQPFTVGPFVRAEWRFLFLKAGYYFDLSNPDTTPLNYPVIAGGAILRF